MSRARLVRRAGLKVGLAALSLTIGLVATAAPEPRRVAAAPEAEAKLENKSEAKVENKNPGGDKTNEKVAVSPPAPGMKARVFQLKNRDVEDLVDAIRPLLSDNRGVLISKSDSLKTITARDFPENLAAVDMALKRLDVPTPPKPDIELQIRVLIGSPNGGQGHVPGELDAVVKQLGTTLSYKTYHLVTSVTQRVRAGGGTNGKGDLLLMPPASDEKAPGHFAYQIDGINMPPGGATPDGTPMFGLRRCKFSLDADGLGAAEVTTGLTLREGEKVVVGTGTLKNRAMIIVVSARTLRP